MAKTKGLISFFAVLLFLFLGNAEVTFAQSGCIGNYITDSNGRIRYYNPVSGSFVTLGTFSSTNINAGAVQPSTGNIYFINRSNNRVVVFDPTNNTFTTRSGTLSTSLGTIVGSTFTNNGTFYVMYDQFRIIQVNPNTGSQIGSTITLTGVPGDGFSPPGTNGDLVTDSSGQLWLVGNTGPGVSRLYRLTITGTNATATPFSPNISGASGSANGLSIDPSDGRFYITTNAGIYELNPTSGVATLRASGGANDLSSCAVQPALPTISKVFSPDSASSFPATSTLTITIGNTNSTENFLTTNLTDNLPSGMVVANPSNLGGTCSSISGNTITASAGSTTVTFSSGGKIPINGCTIQVDVTVSSAGTYVNTIPAGGLQTLAGSNASPATDTFTGTSIVTADLRIFKRQREGTSGSFVGTNLTVNAGQTIQYRIVARNYGSATVTNATFTDSVPSNITGLTIVSVNGLNGATSCTASFGTAPNQNNLSGSFSGPTDARCRVIIQGTATTPGTITNTAVVIPPTGVSDPQCSGSPLVCTGNNDSSVTMNIISPPNVGLVKSCPLPADCTSAPQLPDTELTYQIDFTNSGGADASGLIIVDGTPANTDYKLGSATSNVGTTGMTFTIEFSDDYNPSNPTVATWGYTPMDGGGGADTGFDRNVRAIRWRVTAGTLSFNSPNNNGNVSFVVKIR